MKKIILLFILIQSNLFSQNFKQVLINGKLIIEGDDIAGITVYNVNSKLGTVTNEKGFFSIEASLNDVLQIKSLTYENLNIVINEAILKSRKLRVYLIEEINILDEIIIPSKPLTGNLKEDAKRANLFTQKLDDVYFGLKRIDKTTINDDLTKQPLNKPIDGTLVDGLNIINVVDQLLIPLFRAKGSPKKDVKIPAVPDKSIKYYLGANFLTENFKIPEHRVEEFIRYVGDDAFNFDLLNYGNELEFLELLHTKSKLFLKK